MVPILRTVFAKVLDNRIVFELFMQHTSLLDTLLL